MEKWHRCKKCCCTDSKASTKLTARSWLGWSAPSENYQWWLQHVGCTVKVTNGAFSGYVGRLSGPLSEQYGTVRFCTGLADHAYIREVQVIWADLKVVNNT